MSMATSLRPTRLPVLGALGSRVASLLLLIALARNGGVAHGTQLVVLAGLLGSALVFIDPGVATAITLPLGKSWSSRAAVQAMSVHVVAVGAAAAISMTWFFGFVDGPKPGWAITTALVFNFCLDSGLRPLRSALLVEGEMTRAFAMDSCAAVTRLAAACALVLGATDNVIALILTSAGVLVFPLAYRGTQKMLARHGALAGAFKLRDIAPLAVSTVLSSGYSQIQIPLASLYLNSVTVATLTIVVRLVQGTEIVPGQISSVLLARASPGSGDHAVPLRAFWAPAVALMLGFLACAVAISVLGNHREVAAILGIVSLSVPLKWLNYGLVARLLLRTRLWTRVAGSAIAMVLSLPVTLAMTRHGPLTAAASFVAAEVILLGSLMTLGAWTRSKS
jgi:hypothetical protein